MLEDRRARLALGLAAVALVGGAAWFTVTRPAAGGAGARSAADPAAAVHLDARGDIVLSRPGLVRHDLSYGLPHNCEQVKVAMGQRVTIYRTEDKAPREERAHMVVFDWLGERLCPYRDYAAFRAGLLKGWSPEYEHAVVPPLPGPPGAFRD